MAGVTGPPPIKRFRLRTHTDAREFKISTKKSSEDRARSENLTDGFILPIREAAMYVYHDAPVEEFFTIF